MSTFQEQFDLSFRQRPIAFQKWIENHFVECLDHLEHIYSHFVPQVKEKDTNLEDDVIQDVEQRFKSWISESLKDHKRIDESNHLTTHINETKEEVRRELLERFTCETEEMKNEIALLKQQKAEHDKSSQSILNDLERQAAQKDLYYSTMTNQLRLEVEKTKFEGLRQMQEAQERYQQEIAVFLKQYTTSSSATKGQSAQIAYTQLISEIFPQSEIEETNHSPRNCDIRLIVDNLSHPIMFEIKNYTTTVPSLEVDKFKRDTTERACHGIMISQSTGIATKIDQQVEINNGFINIYLCNNRLNGTSIKTAVESIRGLSTHIRPKIMAQAGLEEETVDLNHRMVSNENIFKIVEELNNIANINTRIKDNLRATINFINVEHTKNIQRLLTGEVIELEQPTKRVKQLARKR